MVLRGKIMRNHRNAVRVRVSKREHRYCRTSPPHPSKIGRTERALDFCKIREQGGWRDNGYEEKLVVENWWPKRVRYAAGSNPGNDARRALPLILKTEIFALVTRTDSMMEKWGKKKKKF